MQEIYNDIKNRMALYRIDQAMAEHMNTMIYGKPISPGVQSKLYITQSDCNTRNQSININHKYTQLIFLFLALC